MGKSARSALTVFAVVCFAAAGPGCRRPRRVAAVDYRAVLTALAEAKRPAAAATAVQGACRSDQQPCQCAEIAARAALDSDLHPAAIRVLDSAPRECKNAALLTGERAEALARAGQTDAAQRAAEAALGSGASNPYAELALARLAYDKTKLTEWHDHAAKALQYGRGSEAARLLGRAALSRDVYDEAEGYFKQVEGAEADDIEAAFSLGICADKIGNYREAREEFLHTLRIDPKHVDARIYLVMLTLNAGATDEARHNLQELAKIVPKGDARLTQLEQLVDNVGDRSVAPNRPGTVQGKR